MSTLLACVYVCVVRNTRTRPQTGLNISLYLMLLKVNSNKNNYYSNLLLYFKMELYVCMSVCTQISREIPHAQC